MIRAREAASSERAWTFEIAVATSSVNSPIRDSASVGSGSSRSVTATLPHGSAHDVDDTACDCVGIVGGACATVDGDDLPQRRRARDDGRRAARQRLQRGKAERFVRPGRERHVGGGQQRGHVCAVVDETGEADGEFGGLALEPPSQRTVTDHEQSRIYTRTTKGGKGIDAAIDAFLDRQAAAVHQ